MSDALGRRVAELERRLAELDDLRAIEQLKYRYFRACDAKDVEGFRDCFAEGEIVIEYGRIGAFDDRDALTAAFEEMACHPHIVEMHHAHHPQVALVEADLARGEWGLHYRMLNTRDRDAVQLGGRYLDEYRRVDGRWRIRASRFEVESTEMLDFSAGRAEIGLRRPPRARGRRRPAPAGLGVGATPTRAGSR